MTVEDRPGAGWERAWLAAERLPAAYAGLAARYFAPLAEQLAALHRKRGRPLLVGVNGSQGSGKSTCCAWLVQALREEHGLSALALSLDDFYLTRAERAALAATVHPLLATRGVPGTHDVGLLRATLGQLLGQEGTTVVHVPRFDKASDDRAPAARWDRVEAPVAVILLEGWCLGARPQPPEALVAPVNALEVTEDRDGRWRRYVNAALRDAFLPLYQAVDHWVMLRAPSFDCVYRWRLEQEHKLRARAGAARAVMSDAEVARFVQYFERLTRHCLAELPDHMDVIFSLDNDRQIIRAEGLPVTMHTARHSASDSDQTDSDQTFSAQTFSDQTFSDQTFSDQTGAGAAYLVFSDLDGTLLDHHSYSHAAAQPAIDLLDSLAIPLVLVSSKTRAEMVALRRRLGNVHPFVVENGAAVFIPEGYFPAQPAGTVARDGYWIRELAAPRARWIALLESLEDDFPGRFEYFARAGEAGIAAMTGLPPAQAALANAREYSEPVQWRGDAAGLEAFLAACAAGGARVSRGGRFYSLGGEADKGEALRWLRAQFAMARGIRHIKDLAAGDGANDVPMLESAGTALLVRAPDRPLPPVQRSEGVLCSDAVGPAGWAEGVTQWLCENGLVTQDS